MSKSVLWITDRWVKIACPYQRVNLEMLNF